MGNDYIEDLENLVQEQARELEVLRLALDATQVALLEAERKHDRHDPVGLVFCVLLSASAVWVIVVLILALAYGDAALG